MQPPDELMVTSFLPAMRQLVAVDLRGRGLSQNKIASLLGVTQASVSMYLSNDPQRAYETLSKLSVSKAAADLYADALASGVLSAPVAGVEILGGMWTKLLGSGAVCQAHRALYPSLADCDYCIKEYGSRGGEVAEAVDDVSSAVRLIEESRPFVEIMPEVSVNIARATDKASSPADVVAIPGRIVRVKDRAKAMLPPEAGASVHMARILLLVRRKHPSLMACINVRYDGRVKSVFRSLRLRTLNVGPHGGSSEVDSTAELLEARMDKHEAAFDVLIDEGGEGVEPNAYLFAKTAVDVARLAIKVARAYSAG